MISGLLFSARLVKGHPTPAWQLDLHRFLGGSALVLTVLHLAGLIADSYVQFDLADLLVPFVSSWKPLPVALGIGALYLLLAVEVTSLLLRRLPRRFWHAVHLSSYLMFWLATFHLLAVGTDASNALARVAAILVMATVVFLTHVRILSPRGRSGSRSSTDRAAHVREPAPLGR